jgi:hypothetical protein
MSRLDDELRNAFRRESPPADFIERLLARVAKQPAPQLRWWQKLAMLLEPPKLRWVAIGVTASLLLAIGAAQYSRLHQVAVNDNGKVAGIRPSPESTGTDTFDPNVNVSQKDPATFDQPSPRNVKRQVNSTINHRLAAARHQKEQELRAAGEAAKEKLMLALYIASSALNDAEKAIHDDGLKP